MIYDFPSGKTNTFIRFGTGGWNRSILRLVLSVLESLLGAIIEAASGA